MATHIVKFSEIKNINYTAPIDNLPWKDFSSATTKYKVLKERFL